MSLSRITQGIISSANVKLALAEDCAPEHEHIKKAVEDNLHGYYSNLALSDAHSVISQHASTPEARNEAATASSQHLRWAGEHHSQAFAHHKDYASRVGGSYHENQTAIFTKMKNAAREKVGYKEA